jgi:1-acyl-sn-glycerol-3-phosphate acyltransferase
LSIASHCKALISLLAITLNLAFWCVPILVLGLIKGAVPSLRKPLNAVLEWTYRSAVRIDDAWLKGVTGLCWSFPPLELGRTENVIVLSNHVSWADIFLIQSLVAREGPILKFLAKRELIFVPIFGAIFWAFDFPIVRRRSSRGGVESERRRVDFEAIKEACRVLELHPAALVNFAEGTRFTEAKRVRQESDYTHLLAPRVGGLSAVLDALAENPPAILDVTLKYAQNRSFWEFLGGEGGLVEIDAVVIEASEIPSQREARAVWLSERWARKDQQIAAFRRERG